MTFSVRPALGSEVELLVSFNAAMAAESEDKGLDSGTLRHGIEHVFAHPDDGRYQSLHQHVQALAEQDPVACGLRLYVEKQNHGAQATYQAMQMTETHYQLWEIEFNESRG
jgi:hypothetical protein